MNCPHCQADQLLETTTYADGESTRRFLCGACGAKATARLDARGAVVQFTAVPRAETPLPPRVLGSVQQVKW